MKIQKILYLIGVLALSACVPNRLTQSLPPPSAEQPAPTNTATASSPTELVATPTDAAAATPDQPEVAPTPSGRNLQPQLALAQIDPDEIVALLPPDAIRAINPDEVAQIMVTAADADANGMEPGTRVLGVSINGDSRAYPIAYMSSHEIVNEEVGGRLIAATW